MQVEPRPYVTVRGIYGGLPRDVESGEKSLDDFGVNAIFMHSGSITSERADRVKHEGARLFAEFNSMHFEKFLEEHPDAAPVGVDGNPSPPPHDWQGVCPTHEGYRRNRMETFAKLLEDFPLDGVWLDYHHSHASWERAEPAAPDTCFCERCLERFREETGVDLGDGETSAKANRLLGELNAGWVRWRCDLFTDWVREYREVADATAPGKLLGTFHCPWSDDDRDGARIGKLAIDLEAQAEFIDVFSIMPYHARFGHAGDLDWIARQIAWLGGLLGIEGTPDERRRIWPIVQLSDWGEPVRIEDIQPVLERATRPPATGVTVFAWGGVAKEQAKVDELTEFYRAIGA